MIGQKWGPKEGRALVKILEQVTSWDAFIVSARKEFDYPTLTRSNLSAQCARLGIAPGSYINRNRTAQLAALPPEQFHARIERETREQRLERQAADLRAACDHLREQLKDREDQISTLTVLKQSPERPIVARKGRGEGQRPQGVPVMFISDLHIEERVTLAATNGMNEYNPTIAEQMIDRCADGFEWLTRDPRWDMREAVIGLGGDLFSGYIHDELAETNFMSPVQATVWLRDRLIRLFATILKNTKFERIKVPCNDGNHGRLTHKIRASTRTANSLEWLLYKTLASHFEKEPRLEFQIAEGLYTYTDIYGATLAITHGDQFQYQGGVGGNLIPIRRGLNEVRKYRDVKFFLMGHHHTFTPGVDIAINGSGIGITPWAISKNFPPEPRQQMFFLIDSHGRKTLTAPIWGPKTGTV